MCNIDIQYAESALLSIDNIEKRYVVDRFAVSRPSLPAMPKRFADPLLRVIAAGKPGRNSVRPVRRQARDGLSSARPATRQGDHGNDADMQSVRMACHARSSWTVNTKRDKRDLIVRWQRSSHRQRRRDSDAIGRTRLQANWRFFQPPEPQRPISNGPSVGQTRFPTQSDPNRSQTVCCREACQQDVSGFSKVWCA